MEDAVLGGGGSHGTRSTSLEGSASLRQESSRLQRAVRRMHCFMRSRATRALVASFGQVTGAE